MPYSDLKTSGVFEDFPGGSDGKKNLPAVQKIWVWSLGWEDTLKKEMGSHSSILSIYCSMEEFGVL